MNKVILCGRLTNEPEVRVTAGNGSEQLTIARYTLAVDRRSKGEQTADFISCVAMGKAGDFAQLYLHKGTKILVEGAIRTGSYTNKDGQKVYTTTVNVSNQEFCESKGNSNDAPSAQNAAASFDGFVNVPMGVEDEGLPFC